MKTFERRDFLKLASLAGLGVAVGGLPLDREAKAADAYTGPLWIMIHASGGWDPTSHCDPKGANGDMDPDPMNHYLASAVPTVPGSASNMRYAPDPAGATANKDFFEKYYKDLLVINGIDFSTNSHDVGTRVAWSGTLTENKPAFAALVAGVYAPSQPMAFITNGGYDTTAGVVAATRLGNIDAVKRIAYPDIIDPLYDQNQTPFHSQETSQRITDARTARYQAYLAKQNLPRLRNAMNMLYTARIGQNELKKLTDYLPQQLEQSNLRRQVQIAMAAYRAGVCVSANLSVGGFDTHGNNDQQQFPRVAQIWDGIDFLMTEAAAQGIKDNIVVVVGSDFGRTPGYNDGDGKDHWSISSMLMMGKGIVGDRVIGQTDERHNPLKVNPSTLQVDDNGVRIAPGHIHTALRKLAGIDQNPIVQKFPVKEEEVMPIFG